MTDSLTGMFNRRGFFEQAAQPCLRASKGAPLCAIMVDIDHFKRINDVYGHDAGDKAIFAVAHELMSGNWHAGRLGGEEFALLLDGRAMARGRGDRRDAAGADRGTADPGGCGYRCR